MKIVQVLVTGQARLTREGQFVYEPEYCLDAPNMLPSGSARLTQVIGDVIYVLPSWTLRET